MHRLLTFARDLRHATTFVELLEIAQREVAEAVGYAHVWMYVSEGEPTVRLRLLAIAGSNRDDVWEKAPVLTVAGDAMMEEICQGDAPVIVEDARTDPRTDKHMVAQFDNRTIVNIPLRLLDQPLGALGMGTFGEEGCRAPTSDQVNLLLGMASQLSVAAGRIRFVEERNRAESEKRELERRLYQMQKLESLGVLAGGVAHDFNNLLTVVLACGGLLRRSVADPVQLAEVNAIIGAAERGQALTLQLLAMSRTSVLRMQPLNLNDRIDQSIALLRRVLPETIEIDLVKSANLPLVEGDGPQLDQVFMNLCINARDAMPDGGTLTLETEQVLVNGPFTRTHTWAKPGRYVLVSVTDTGTGMPPAVVERIFEPFFTTKESTGTGLGLAVAYGIVRQHRGMLSCYSEVGIGTTFKIYLPVLSREASTVGTKLQPPVRRGVERILVAEDDVHIRDVAERVLRSAGYVVATVADGVAAVDLAHTEEFDLIILDGIMPRMNGVEALERIRAERPHQRALLSSGYLGDTKARVLLAAPNVRFLQKPYGLDSLLRAVREALDEEDSS